MAEPERCKGSRAEFPRRLEPVFSCVPACCESCIADGGNRRLRTRQPGTLQASGAQE
jgi:hypothetical protein